MVYKIIDRNYLGKAMLLLLLSRGEGERVLALVAPLPLPAQSRSLLPVIPVSTLGGGGDR